MSRSTGDIHHIEINVSDLKKSSSLYQKFLGRLGYTRTLEEEDVVGWRKGRSRIFLVSCEKRFLANGFHRERVGLNHIAFWASSKREVDRFHDFLLKQNVPILYDGPREYPEYMRNYYAVYFEDPDRIKLEFVYSPR